MSRTEDPRHVEVTEEGQTVAAADVSKGADGDTVRVSLRAAAGHITPGRRASLVDAVMELPEVQESDHLEAAVPRGDTEMLERLRERTDDTSTRSAGATVLLDADVPSDD